MLNRTRSRRSRSCCTRELKLRIERQPSSFWRKRTLARDLRRRFSESAGRAVRSVAGQILFGLVSNPINMKAIQVRQPGGPEALEAVEIAVPQPKPKEALV